MTRKTIQVTLTTVILTGLAAMAAGVIFLWPRVARPSEKTFADVARRVYGDENLWLPLAAANPGRVVRPWMVLKLPSRRAAQEWLRGFRERRGMPPDLVFAPFASEGWPFALSAESERWMADTVELASPDGCWLLYDLRGLESPSAYVSLFLCSRSLRRVEALSQPEVWVDGRVSLYWRNDSRVFVAKIETGLDHVQGEGPGTHWAYVIGDISEDERSVKHSHFNSNADLSAAEIRELMKLDMRAVEQRLAAPAGK